MSNLLDAIAPCALGAEWPWCTNPPVHFVSPLSRSHPLWRDGFHVCAEHLDEAISDGPWSINVLQPGGRLPILWFSAKMDYHRNDLTSTRPTTTEELAAAMRKERRRRRIWDMQDDDQRRDTFGDIGGLTRDPNDPRHWTIAAEDDLRQRPDRPIRE